MHNVISFHKGWFTMPNDREVFMLVVLFVLAIVTFISTTQAAYLLGRMDGEEKARNDVRHNPD